jgi:hypothetical protein
MAETLRTEAAGVPIHEHSERDEKPRCHFGVALPDDAAEGSDEGQQPAYNRGMGSLTLPRCR